MPHDVATQQAAEIAKLLEIGNRVLSDHNQREAELNGRIADDHREAASLMLAFRTAEFALSAVDDFQFNRPAAGAVIGRAILETALTLRWCLLSDDNARRWWREGDAAIQKSLRTMALSDDPDVVALREAKAIGVGLPGFPAMAKAVGLTVPYSRWYPTLCSYAHASRMSTGHAYSRASQGPLPALIHPCIYFVNDVGTVVSVWWRKQEVPSPWPHP
jgi:hypothetical protein